MAKTIPQLDVARTIADGYQGKAAKRVEIVGAWGSGKTLIAAQVAESIGASLLYVAAGRIDAEAAHEDLSTFTDPDRCVFMPAWEVLPTDAMDPADDIVAERMHGLNRLLLARDSGTPVVLTVSVRSLLQRIIDPARLRKDRIRLAVGNEYALDDLLERLTALGYERELMVEQRGQMSLRGGIFDVFPISAELPFRVEFFGDEIESIRLFEPETQRSVESVESVEILPRSERELIEEQVKSGGLACLSSYFPPNTIVALDEPLAIRREAENLEAHYGDTPFMASWETAMAGVDKAMHLRLAQVTYERDDTGQRIDAPMHSMTAWQGQADGFWERFQAWDAEGYTVQLYCNNTGERRRLLELLEEKGYTPGSGDFDLRVAIGRLHSGFWSEPEKLAVLSEREMFGRKYVRRRRRRFEAGAAITTFSDLKPGDYIVHIDHGIGRYLGLKRFPEKLNDFIAIQYAGRDVVYVPVTHVDQIQKYVGGGGAVPKIDRLGGASWRKTKSRVRKAVREMTEELLKLYAARDSQPGFAFSSDTHWQREFEDSFEYEETVDQARAVIEVKADMEKPRPMDRLLCGDVGFGKTEVAIRAAFKAVMDHKQVAVLVPTTVLAEQHYLTFKQRMADYPIRVEMLSRFRTGKEIGQIVRQLRQGEIDIVIGTHRLTSGDVAFKDLGLVILDEEHRFGVRHKEKLKQLKTNVDVLAMTATPIPRTLHMSMSGVRDLSIINTAPNDRLPIHTCIEVFDGDLIREAIERELAREGQAFYLHNRVQTIDRTAGMLKKLIPDARIAVGHGQLPEDELESVMTRFIRHEFDVLVCTTIIGSGLDIPNANTIVIDRADRFGLAELYQIRGRVGRYKHRAFAYLLVPGDRALTREAQERLKALEEFSTLGAGFRVAMRDLEIRGAGNILGAQQSGHIAAVGFETYNELIAEAVAEAKGEPVKVFHLPAFDINTDAYIPDDYVEIESQKITLYKRISSLRSQEEIDDMVEELNDRFGPPPESVRRLLEVMEVRVLGSEIGARKLYASKEQLTVEFDSKHYLEKANQPSVSHAFGERLRFAWQEQPSIICSLNGDDPVALGKRLMTALQEA